MADYLALSFYVILINAIPAFMPPTWVVLALALMHDASFDPVILTIVGAISSTMGRGVLSFYSGFFRRFFSKKFSARADEIRGFFRKKDTELFLGTFLYSLSPLPSNFIFLAKGLTKTDSLAVFPGFFAGRLISYFTLVVLSNHIFISVGNYAENEFLVMAAFDLLGIAAAFSFLLIDWGSIQSLKVGKKEKGPARTKTPA